jgi:hypothetical protein
MKIIKPKTEILYLGTVDQGKQLAINFSDSTTSYDVLTILADDKDESLWIELEVGNSLVQIPIEIVERAIKLAREDVHSESWYEKNVYNKFTE